MTGELCASAGQIASFTFALIDDRRLEVVWIWQEKSANTLFVMVVVYLMHFCLFQLRLKLSPFCLSIPR